MAGKGKFNGLSRLKPLAQNYYMPLAQNLLIFFFATLVAIFSSAAHAQVQACDDVDPKMFYSIFKAEIHTHNTYTAIYWHETYRGKNHEVWARGRAAGRYLREPAHYCEKRLSWEASFPEQAGPGYQECYTGADDLTRVLMPPPLSAIGIITLFPEDPKTNYLNGENLKTAAVWTWFENWDRMLEGGGLEATCAELKGKEHWLLEIQRGKNPDPLYHHERVKIWVDRESWFPMRVETYAEGDQKPVMIYDFEEVQLDAPLTEKDMDFEGTKPDWSLVKPPEGPTLSRLKPEEPRLEPDPALTPEKFVNMLDEALAGVNDYETVMTLALSYFRLRQVKQDRFFFIRADKSFAAVTSRLEANYIPLNAGVGFRMVFDPSRDRLLHIIPAGVYKLTGEQTFPLDDPRLFTAMGDNVTELDFFSIRDTLKLRLKNAVDVRTGIAGYAKMRGPWLEVKSPGLGIQEQPTIMRLLLDPQTHLPARLEYRGYDDPQGFIAITFINTQTNSGQKSQDLWKRE